MNRIVFKEKVDETFGNSLVKFDCDKYYLPCEIFGIIKLKDYILFLEAVSNEWSFQFSEIGGFQFGPLDGSLHDEIEKLADDEVEIGLGDESVRISKKEFFQLCSDFGHKVIEAIVWFELESKEFVSLEWIEKMKLLVKGIDLKIENRNSSFKCVFLN